MARTEGSRNIRSTVRGLIKFEAIEKRQKPRGALAIELMEKIERMGEVVPTQETIERLISEARNHDDPEDEPWSTGTLGNYPISHGVLQTVFAVCKYARDDGNAFTIRQAKWAARLSGVLREKELSDLWKWTVRYAGAELISRLLKCPLDTASLDAQLMGLPPPQEDDTEYQEWLARQHEKALSQIAARGESQIVGNVSIHNKALGILENREGEQSKNHNRTKRQTRGKKGDKK